MSVLLVFILKLSWAFNSTYKVMKKPDLSIENLKKKKIKSVLLNVIVVIIDEI